jgi:flagellar motility protein MotE (MotC chaperone)
MTRWLRDLRLVPVVLVATVCLLALKVSGLLLDGGYTLADSGSDRRDALAAPGSVVVAETGRVNPGAGAPAQPREHTWAREMFNFPDVTGTLAAQKQAEKNSESKPETSGKPPAPEQQGPVDPPPDPGGKPVSLDPNGPASAGEKAVLGSLQQRRQELDARARELDIRESLLKAAEKRLDARAAELKQIEQRINTAMQKKDEAEAARFKGLVTMYENMKAKDAARIFDRLDMKILMEVATQINPRRMSDILAQMSPEAAEKLTIELANRASGGDKTPPASDLPKIDGRPNGT